MQLPDDVAALMTRDHFKAWLKLLEPAEATDFDDVASLAGIVPLGSRWHETDRPGAEAFLKGLLHWSLAQHVELMPEAAARSLAAQFLDAAGSLGARYATNSDGQPGSISFEWDPATEHTFDAGVVAIGAKGAALFWVADED